MTTGKIYFYEVWRFQGRAKAKATFHTLCQISFSTTQSLEEYFDVVIVRQFVEGTLQLWLLTLEYEHEPTTMTPYTKLQWDNASDRYAPLESIRLQGIKRPFRIDEERGAASMDKISYGNNATPNTGMTRIG